MMHFDTSLRSAPNQQDASTRGLRAFRLSLERDYCTACISSRARFRDAPVDGQVPRADLPALPENVGDPMLTEPIELSAQRLPPSDRPHGEIPDHRRREREPVSGPGAEPHCREMQHRQRAASSIAPTPRRVAFRPTANLQIYIVDNGNHPVRSRLRLVSQCAFLSFEQFHHGPYYLSYNS